jgi:hypothetical protein
MSKVLSGHGRRYYPDSGSAIGHQQAKLTPISFVDDLALPQSTFAFARFLGQDMTGVGFVINKLPGSCSFKPFGSRPVGFNFRHLFLSFMIGFFSAARGRPSFMIAIVEIRSGPKSFGAA